MMQSLLFQIICLLFLLHNVHGAPKGLAANNTQCSNGCSWSDPTIWTGGTVPTSTDTVSLQLKGLDYTVTLDVDATVADFDVGTSKYSEGKHTFVISAGRTLTSTGQFNTQLTSTVIIEANGTLICSGSSTVAGALTINGVASFGGSTTSLSINTQDVQIQLPTNIVYATLTMNGGNLTVPNGLLISSTSNLLGYGNIFGSVDLKGTFQPGLEGKIGSVNISGDLQLTSKNAEIYIDIKSDTEFDHIYIGQSCVQAGSLYANPIGGFSPLPHSEFVCFNHTKLRNGFDTVRQKGITHIIGNKWQAVPDQDYTALLYDSATTVFISFATIAACLVFTLL